MKKRFAVLALVFSLILSLASTAFAYTVPSDTVVYVTPTGECYHLYNCSYIKNSWSSMTIADAEYRGYRPCSRCDPDVMVGTYGDSYVYKHPSVVVAESKAEAAKKAEAANPQAEEKKSTTEYPWWVFSLVGIGADRVYLKLRSKEE